MTPRPDTLAKVAELRNEGEEAYRIGLAQYLDAFYKTPERRQAMIDSEPPPTGSALIDATLGAIGEHLARRWDLIIPTWTGAEFRFLHRPHFATPIQALKASLLAQSPIAFRRRMIFVEYEPLRRARMPLEQKHDPQPA